MKQRIGTALFAAALVFLGATAPLSAAEPDKAQPMNGDLPADETASAEVETSSMPTVQEILSAVVAAGPPGAAPKTCICASFKATCQDMCGVGNYHFDCSRHVQVSCTCLDGSGGWTHPC